MAKNIKNLYAYGVPLIFFSIWFFGISWASSSEMYPLNSASEEGRFQQLVQETRCLVCQNQNLADSNAPLAKDLRQIIYEKIKKGESEQAVKKYLVDRYGEYILFKPKFSPLTYFLWLGPFILLIIIVAKLMVGTRRIC
jgi:cytochrome c-type biogenesis protein CcmH